MKGTSRRLVVLLTDGEIPSMNIGQWKALLQVPGARTWRSSPRRRLPARGGSQQLAAALPEASWSQTDNPGAWAAVLRQIVLAEVRGIVETTPLRWTAGTDLSATAASWDCDLAKAGSVGFGRVHHGFRDGKRHGGGRFEAAAGGCCCSAGIGESGAVAIGDDGSAAYQTLRQRPWCRRWRRVRAIGGLRSPRNALAMADG